MRIDFQLSDERHTVFYFDLDEERMQILEDVG